MLKILYFLFRGKWPCTHRWQVEQKVDLQSSGLDIFGSKQVHVGTRYYLRCEHCGEMKVFEHY